MPVKMNAALLIYLRKLEESVGKGAGRQAGRQAVLCAMG
jgi:hypothetical protein